MSDAPKGNASAEEWLSYAHEVAGRTGVAPEDYEHLNRDELRDLFGPKSPTAALPKLPTSDEVSAGYRPPPEPVVSAGLVPIIPLSETR